MNPDPNNPAHRELVEKAAANITCPLCGRVGLEISWSYRSQPIVGIEATAQEVAVVAEPIATCPGCGLEARPPT